MSDHFNIGALIVVSAKEGLSFPNVSIGDACRNDSVLAETMIKAVFFLSRLA
ncbi:MAG: hypothetical protein PF482_21010 [Desulfobacteraceae bacterium]|jgi:hypothetical protein|nr:hypothetical protein [Desulfobacteraceae bacterium]